MKLLIKTPSPKKRKEGKNWIHYVIRDLGLKTFISVLNLLEIMCKDLLLKWEEYI